MAFLRFWRGVNYIYEYVATYFSLLTSVCWLAALFTNVDDTSVTHSLCLMTFFCRVDENTVRDEMIQKTTVDKLAGDHKRDRQTSSEM